MGKPKKLRAPLEPIAVSELRGEPGPQQSINGSPSPAADGRNVDGWSPADVKTYNDLLHERAKLEREKNALEKKAERRSTERVLLNRTSANFESLFSKQSCGDYKYLGKNACCLDTADDKDCSGTSDRHNVPCKHEICTRAKKSVISWMEFDTIKYYDIRILTEKSDRMKNALRKQREVDLIRVKKVEDEENAARARKTALLDKADREALRRASEQSARSNGSSSGADYQRDTVLEAAKQNDSELSQIRDELEDIKRQVDAGKVNSSDLRTKLDLAQAKMGEAERRNNLFRQMILEVESVKTQADAAFSTTANLDEDLKKLCTTAENAVAQAMTIMKDFFSASGPDQMEETMTRLKTTLESRGPMPKNMRDSFRELETMVAESKAKGLKMDFKVDYGGVVTGDSMVETMIALRKKMKEGVTPPVSSGTDPKLDEELAQANRGCLKIEQDAEAEMEKAARKLKMEKPDTLLQELTDIKADAVAKSPIPPLSDIMLDAKVQSLLDIHNAKALLKKTVEGVSDQQIDAELTSWVLAKSQKKAERFSAAFAAVLNSLQTAAEQKLPEQIRIELLKVEKSMQAWAEKQASLKLKESKALPTDDTSPASRVQTAKSAEQLRTDENSKLALDKSELTSILRRVSSSVTTQSDVVAIRLLKDILSDHPEHTLWAFQTFQRLQAETSSVVVGQLPTSIDLDHIGYDEKDSMALFSYISALYAHRTCPGASATSVAHAMANLARKDRKKVETDIRLLGALSITAPESTAFDNSWFKSFALIAGAMVRLHSSILGQVERLFSNRSHDVLIAAAVVSGVMDSTSLDAVTDQQMSCTDVARKFIEFWGADLSDDLEDALKDIGDVWTSASALCIDLQCRCGQPNLKRQERAAGSPSDSQRQKPKASSQANGKAVSLGRQQPQTAKVHKLLSRTPSQQYLSISPSVSPVEEQSMASAKLSAKKGPGQLSIRILPGRTSKAKASTAEAHKFDPEGMGAKDSLKPVRLRLRMTRQALEGSQIHLRAYELAHLNPPPSLVAAAERLEAVTSDSNIASTDGSGEQYKLIACLHGHDPEGSHVCTCDQCVNFVPVSNKAGVSKFVEHFDPDETCMVPSVTKRQKREAVNLGKKRVQEIIETKTTRQYLTFLANNLLRRSLSATFQSSLAVFDEFESFFTSIGPIPKQLQRILDLAKARLLKLPMRNIPGVKIFAEGIDVTKTDQELHDLFCKLAAREDDIFLSDADWKIRKSALCASETMEDTVFDEFLTALVKFHLQTGRQAFEGCIDGLIKAFKEGGAVVGDHFKQIVASIQEKKETGRYKTSHEDFEDLEQMMSARWRITAVELPGKEKLALLSAIEKATSAEDKAAAANGKGNAAQPPMKTTMAENHHGFLESNLSIQIRRYIKSFEKFMNITGGAPPELASTEGFKELRFKLEEIDTRLMGVAKCIAETQGFEGLAKDVVDELNGMEPEKTHSNVENVDDDR